jgi:hypothetical protein
MKPSDLYAGVGDIFSILLPGLILTGALVQFGAMDHLRKIIPPLESEAERAAAFILAAYAVGHFVFLVSSFIDRLYNYVRPKDKPGDAYTTATQLRKEMLGGSDDIPMNTFKWAQALLVQKSPTAAALVHRLEADSKFFRSVAVVLIAIFALMISASDHVTGIASLLLVIPAFWRYAERRYQSTQWAYYHTIVYFRSAAVEKTRTSNRGSDVGPSGPD